MYDALCTKASFILWQAILMKKQAHESYSPLFLRFLHDFGLKGTREYEKLTPEEKKITDRAYLKDLPNLIKKYKKRTATE